MKSVVIVDGYSSAILYFQEAMMRGFQSIVVNSPHSECSQSENFRQVVGNKAIFINVEEDTDYDKMLNELKKYDISCVVAGGDSGVRYADRIADDLGLLGNGSDSTWRRRTKAGMSKSLEEAGIRGIKTAVVRSEQDIIDFWKDNDLKKGFMKYSESASSVGNKLCLTIEDAIEHFHKLYGKKSSLEVLSDVLLQEYIEGDEYIVNTVSCEGKHLVTDIWKYRKILTAENDVIYESNRLVMEPDPGQHELITYTYKVLDAVGLKYGPCHNEFKIDHKGPVLIEVNARPMGASMTAEYLDEALGHHITDIALDAYLNKEVFEIRRMKPYRPRKMAIMKFLISDRERDVNLLPVQDILNNLKSYRHTNPIIKDKIVHIAKTRDLDESPLFIKLCHDDPNLVIAESDFIHMLETKYPDMLYTMNEETPAVSMRHDPFDALKHLPRTSKMLIDTDDGRFVSHLEKIEKTGDFSWDTYDGLVFALGRKATPQIKYHYLSREIAQVRDGGLVIIYPESFESLPYRSAGMEVILKLLKCKVEVPFMESDGAIIAIKE